MEAIGLNPIRLDAIGIDPIRLNAIRLGVPGASSGSSGRPYIDPEVLASLVAVCICDGKSNNDPDRAVIKNLVDPANPFVISNAAYKLNSGFGKYEISFKEGHSYNNSVVKDVTDKSFNFDAKHLIALLYKSIKVGESNDEPSYKIKISNLSGKLRYYYINDKGSRVYIEFTSNGEYTLPISYDSLAIENAWIGFSSYSASSGTITQIPSFQGALVTDGVNDLITSTKSVQEMLSGSTEITVVSMIANLDSRQIMCNSNYSGLQAYNIRNTLEPNGVTSILGFTDKKGITNNLNLIMGDKNSIKLVDNVNFNSTYKFLPAQYSGTYYQVAWYWTFIAKRALTTDEINQVIAYYNLDKYVKPDIYYDVKKQGLTNDTPDSDWYLKDFSGNGCDMQLYNFAKKLGSGVGKYAEDFTQRPPWYAYQGVNVTSNKISLNSNFRPSEAWIIYKAINNPLNDFKVKIAGIPDGGTLYFYLTGISNKNIKLVNGNNDIKFDMPTTLGSSGFKIENPNLDWSKLVIEQIPDYEGALVFDAVDDYGKAENLPIYKDYTVVADREIVDGLINNADGGVATRGTHYDLGAFCFDYKDGVYSFGATNGYVDRVKPNRFISYMSKYIHNGITTPVGDAVDNNPLCIAKLGSSIDRYSKLALWSFLLFPYSLSEFLLERQLKRYKLGTLYPDMVEFRPIVKSNVEYKQIDYFIRKSGTYVRLNPGDYFLSNEDIIIRVTPIRDWQLDVVSSIKINGKDEVINIGSYTQTNPIHIDKSPQKIDITIDEYIRYEDIVQPYPVIVKILDNETNKLYTYGDKIKVGTVLKYTGATNLLPELYQVLGGIKLNGKNFNSNYTGVIEKTNVFTFTSPCKYLKDNEPNCILAPQILRIPNASYKILGYIPDLTGKGNHGKINNSAYAGMSGANGYKYDWNTWRISKNGITSTITDSSIHITSLKEQYSPNQALFESSSNTSDKSNFKVNITGLTSNIKCTFNNAGAIIKELVNGVNEISVNLVVGWYGFMITALDGSVIGDCNITIQQIGEYEGSFCLDGVEDFITIPTLASGAKQVLMKVNWNSINTIAYDHRNGVGNNDRFAIYLSDINEAIAYNARNSGQTYIDGILNTNIIASQLKDITHNITITNNDVNASNSGILRIGSAYTNSLYTQMALFTFMSFDEISSEDEIKELNDIVGIEGNTDDLFNETNI